MIVNATIKKEGNNMILKLYDDADAYLRDYEEVLYRENLLVSWYCMMHTDRAIIRMNSKGCLEWL